MPSKLDAFTHLLGKVPDARIAEMAGCAVSTVAAARKKAGSVAAGPALDAPASPPADPAPEAPTVAEAEAELAHLTEGATSADEAREMLAEAGADIEELPPSEPAPTAVLITRTFDAKGPDGRWTHYGYRSYYKGDLAAWLWEHHRNRVEAYPPTPAG